VHHALVMLGGDRVRLWTVLIALAEIDDRPDELVRAALIRARMCELVAGASADVRPEAAFSAGLFSLVEAFADAEADEALEVLELPPAVCDAVLRRMGPLGALLTEVVTYTSGAFAALDVTDPVAEERLRDAYLRAVTWADETHRITRALRRG
jgi:c-di-GMP phosphodiesterase